MLTFLYTLIQISCAQTPQDLIIQKTSKAADAFDALTLDTIRDNDPNQGDSDCEEQAVIFYDLLSSRKRFKDFDQVTRDYLTLRFLFSSTRLRDPFGMVVGNEEKEILKTLSLESVQGLRGMITEQVYARIMEIAKTILPSSLLSDHAFIRTPVGKYGLTRISTTGGCLILFEYAKKHNVPLVLRVKRMKIEGERLQGVSETFLPYVYDVSLKRFVYAKEIDPAKPAFFIRMFSVQGKACPLKSEFKEALLHPFKHDKSAMLALVHEEGRLGKFMNEWNRLGSFPSDTDYLETLKNMHVDDLIYVIAAADDISKKRDLTLSKILAPFLKVIQLMGEDGNYGVHPQVLSIRHIYLSTLAQQQKSAQEILDKAGVQSFNEIISAA